jgi:hypothetical protein
LEEHEGDSAEHVGGPVLQTPLLHNLLILDDSQNLASDAAVHQIELGRRFGADDRRRLRVSGDTAAVCEAKKSARE